MASRSGAGVRLRLEWRSDGARHEDERHFGGVDLGRDRLPGELGAALREADVGASVSARFEPGALIAPYDERLRRTLPRAAFATRRASREISLRAGRYYPHALLIEPPAPALAPFRIRSVEGDAVGVDLNHPLAGRALTFTARLESEESPGTRARDLGAFLTDTGPGMQALRSGEAVDYLRDYPLRRADPEEDAAFYQIPRLVTHIDETAIDRVTRLYRRFLSPGARVLDLMGSWVSHLPPEVRPIDVTGLGMNEEELAANRALSRFLVHDLNRAPELLFDAEAFDVVVCTVSIEYLTRPLEVFSEVARTLVPGGMFVNALSDRCFPTKAVDIWHELHPFERLRFVLELYARSGAFTELHTESIQGLPKAADSERPEADPLYAVWGRKRG